MPVNHLRPRVNGAAERLAAREIQRHSINNRARAEKDAVGEQKSHARLMKTDPVWLLPDKMGECYTPELGVSWG